MATSIIVRVAQPVLLDTCTAIWLMGKAPISEQSRKAVRTATLTRSGVYVSAFCAWEIGMLVGKGKIRLTKAPEDWFNELLAKPGIRLSALSPRILLNSTSLPGNPPNDPADRIVAATAREHGYTVLTRDREILDYAGQGHIRAIAS
jgi:PIN domain nuclease of toxin-antitoxin system